MKALWLMPLAFLAGVQGFVMFLPYAVVVMVAFFLARGWQISRAIEAPS